MLYGWNQGSNDKGVQYISSHQEPSKLLSNISFESACGGTWHSIKYLWLFPDFDSYYICFCDSRLFWNYSIENSAHEVSSAFLTLKMYSSFMVSTKLIEMYNLHKREKGSLPRKWLLSLFSDFLLIVERKRVIIL